MTETEWPDDGWEDYLHYGRILSNDEREFLSVLFCKRLKKEITAEEADKMRKERGILLRGEIEMNHMVHFCCVESILL